MAPRRKLLAQSGRKSQCRLRDWRSSDAAMLTAWDKIRETVLALPDHESTGDLEAVRERTRQGELICPECRQALWLRAGPIRIPHFGHRSLNECPHGRVSEPVLAARRQIYLFFRSRTDPGKLRGEVELEPVLSQLQKNVTVDLLLRRAEKPWVAVCLFESSLNPDARFNHPLVIQKQGW